MVYSCAYAFSQDIDSLKKALKLATHDTIKCAILNAMIEAESDIEIWPKYNNELKKLTEKRLAENPSSFLLKNSYQKHLAFALNNIGYLAQIQGNNVKALDYFKLGLIKYNEINYHEGVALTLNNIGYVYQNMGEVIKSLEYYNKSYELFKHRRDKDGIATALNNIANVYEQFGNIPKALEFYHQSLKIREEIKDKKGIAICFNNIGAIYKNQGDLNNSIRYFEKGLAIQKEIKDDFGIAYTYNNIGGVYERKNEPEKALEYYSKGLDLREKMQDYNGIAYSMNNVGSVYNKMGNLKKALEYYSKSLKIFKDLKDKQGESFVLNNIALINLKQNNFQEAEQYCLKSINNAKELGFPDNIKTAASMLVEIYRKQNKGIKALEMHQLYVKMRDSLNNIETQKTAIQRQVQYDYDKKALQDSVNYARETQFKNMKLEMQETEIKAKRYQQYALFGGMALVMIFAGFMYNRFKVTHRQKEIIEIKEKETQLQKQIIEEKQKEIVDSINYAKRIQYTLLAHDEFLNNNLKDYFVLFRPKDIVSGDFYWAAKKGDKFYLAVCDSTGHGVPGAFMSLLNIGFLSEAINEKGIELPNEILNYVRERLIENISKEGQKDGFDGILVCMEEENNVIKIRYAAANNAPVIIKNGKCTELAYDRMPVGVGERKESFTMHTIDAIKGDSLYLYTDGYADQFGGPKGKKFKYKQLEELLISIHQQPLQQQSDILLQKFSDWKATLEQVDDVCIIGLRI